MNGLEIFHMTKKLMNAYEHSCNDVCLKYQLNQNGFDIMMFLANNPQYNTAKDICEIRGMKSGIVSVMVEKLIQRGYLERKNDQKDRRITRLYLTEESKEAVLEGQKAQRKFCNLLSANITEQEMKNFDFVMNKFRKNLEGMEQ